MSKDWNTRTKLVHEGIRRSQYNEVSEAIFLTQGFVYESAEQAEARFIEIGDDEFIYARYGNPTVRMFEERIAALEGAEDAFATASGMAAVNAALTSLLKAGDESGAVNLMPWRVIMMVCGVTVLISVLEATGGLALFTQILAGISTADTVTAIMAFTTGFISIYSSTSGVVLPAFLPTVPDLAQQLGGVDPLAIASSMNIGAHLVDVSALSTLGALCMAAAPKHEDSRKLFNNLMIWGLSMTLVGGATCWLLFTVLRVGLG